MKAILIDAKTEKVNGIEIVHADEARKTFQDPHSLVDVALSALIIDGDNLLFYDEHGVLNNPGTYFHFNGFRRPLYGRGLVIGVGDNGHKSTTLSTKQVLSKVQFHGVGSMTDQ